MEEVLDLDILAEAERAGVEAELDAMLGQKGSEGEHF